MIIIVIIDVPLDIVVDLTVAVLDVVVVEDVVQVVIVRHVAVIVIIVVVEGEVVVEVHEEEVVEEGAVVKVEVEVGVVVRVVVEVEAVVRVEVQEERVVVEEEVVGLVGVVGIERSVRGDDRIIDDHRDHVRVVVVEGVVVDRVDVVVDVQEEVAAVVEVEAGLRLVIIIVKRVKQAK